MSGSIPEIKKGDAIVVSTPPSRICDSLSVGDLVKIRHCDNIPLDYIDDDYITPIPGECICKFCSSNSSRFGVVIESRESRTYGKYWVCLFDFGTFNLTEHNLSQGVVEEFSS